MDFHHVPLAVTDAAKDVRWNCSFGLTWETTKERHSEQLRYENEKSTHELITYILTCREGELYLLIDYFHGDEVVLLIKATVVK